MVVIRPETGDDVPAIREINALAFGREGEARLVDALRASESFLPELSLVAVSDESVDQNAIRATQQRQESTYTCGRVVGHILFTRIHIRTPDRDVLALALAPMAVLPDWQHRGVGSALIRYGLDECRRLGHPIVVVVGHPHYYPRFGFSSAREKGLEAPYPDPAFMVQELVPGALDGVRGTVEYPPAFAAV